MATWDALFRDLTDAKLLTATDSNLTPTCNPESMYQGTLVNSKTMEDQMKLVLALDNLNMDLMFLQEDL